MTPRVHPDLRLDLILDRWVGAPALVLLGVGILSIPLTISDVFPDVHSALLGYALLAPVALPIFWVASRCWRRRQWYERLSWVFYNVPAAPVRADFEPFGDGAICARLSAASGAEAGRPLVFDAFLPTTWDPTRFGGQIVGAHIDPVPGGPVVLVMDDRILWPLEGHRKDLS